MNYKIVSDSASNLYQVPGIDYACVPLKIINGEKEFVDTAKLDILDMVDTLKNTKLRSSTSCPNVHDWLNAFEGGDVVFAVTITSNLSGSHASAVQAAEEYEETHKGSHVHVFDSLSAGGEMGLLVEKIRECIEAGLNFDEIRETVTAYQNHTHLLFTLESLTNLARNGRVNPAVAAAAGVLGIRLVGKASDVGTLEPLHKCRGEKKALDTIYKEMLQNGFCGGKVRIGECLNPAAAESLSRRILTDYPNCDIEVIPCSGLCTFYAEKGGMLIGYEDIAP